MSFLHAPCADCPFLKGGGVRLSWSRILEIAGGMLSPDGGVFHCHKTTIDRDDGDRVATRNSKHCGGALIFAEKNGNATQMMRIARRIGLYDPTKLKGRDLVFDTLEEMLFSSLDVPRLEKL